MSDSADHDAGKPGDSEGGCEDCGALTGHYDDCLHAKLGPPSQEFLDRFQAMKDRHNATVTDYLRAAAERLGLDPDELEHAHLLRVFPSDEGAPDALCTVCAHYRSTLHHQTECQAPRVTASEGS